jgi:hypothetical protein
MTRLEGCLIVAFSLFGCTGLCIASDVPMGIPALTDLDTLPLLRSGTWLVGTDSHDVTGANEDGFKAVYSYLYKDGNEYVLFEEEGPGCIYEIRTLKFEGNLYIYLDGAKRPQHITPFKELYSGRKAPFVSPFVADEAVAYGSCWSYVPITYAKGCKLTTDKMENSKFFNVFAHKYASGTPVRTFDPTVQLDSPARIWSNPHKAQDSGEKLNMLGADISILPRATANIANIRGQGAIKRFRLRFPGQSTDPAADLVIRAYWDERAPQPRFVTLAGQRMRAWWGKEAEPPQVNSPVSTFFALGCPRAIKARQFTVQTEDEGNRYKSGVTQPRSLVVGQGQDGWLYCYFPMPYWQSARIDILNTSYQQAVNLRYAIDYSDKPYPPQSGYFHAQWREENPLRPSEDFCVLDTRGRGNYIGCVLTFSTIQEKVETSDAKLYSRSHLEGDARFYVDDIRTPFVASTGTEEYFNWGWYNMIAHDATFSYPTHGYPLHLVDNQDHSVMYRFHISELVPYYRSFRFDLEHGNIGRSPAHYSGTAFFYQRDTCGLVFTDELDVGDRDSEAGHGYKTEGAVSSVMQVLPYEGSYQLPLTEDAPRDRVHTVKDDGRVWNESCEFTVKTVPNNAGVKLRRRSYYGFGAQGDLYAERKKMLLTQPQRVEVKVDGQTIGDWYLTARHARATWLDSDFEIPAEATRNKERIRISLRSKDGTRWDEYTYWVYAYISEAR